jgi:GTP cyclohydrolase I
MPILVRLHANVSVVFEQLLSCTDISVVAEGRILCMILNNIIVKWLT